MPVSSVSTRTDAVAGRSSKLAVTSNDPAQKVRLSGDSISITGVANNRGIVRSFVQLTLDGKKVNVSLNGGESPTATAKKLGKALPAGYRLSGLKVNGTTGAVLFRIEKTASFPGKVKAAGWNPGQGARPLPGRPVVTPHLYADLTMPRGFAVTATSKLDRATNTIVVTLKAKPSSDVVSSRAMLPTPRGASMGGEYKMVVQDEQGNVLKRVPTFRMVPAM